MIRQLLRIAGFELRVGFARISTWVYFFMLVALGFILMCSAGGAWDGFDTGGGGRLANSPLEIAGNLVSLLMLTLPITAALFGNAVYRDFETRMYPLFFAAPISKLSYLGGRFAAAFVINLFILSGAGLGQAVGTAMPFLKPERVGPWVPVAYLHAYLLLVVPSLLFMGALLFSLAAYTRQMLPNYIGGVALLIGYTIAQDQLGDLESQETAALLDPLGLTAVSVATRYWTVVERNRRLLPLDSLFWTNRALWLGLALLALGLLVWRFRFSHAASDRRADPAGKAGADDPLAQPAPPAPRPLKLPRPSRSFGGRAQLLQYLSTARREFRGIVRSVYFAALVAVGLIFVGFMATRIGELYDTETHPVTYSVLEAVSGSFGLFMIIIIAFYSGELVWNERDTKASQLHDATPVAGWVPVAAKLTALAGVVAVLQAMVGLAGIVTQLSYGYLKLEPGQYLSELFVRQLAMYLLFVVLATTIHVLANHKYVGHFVMILYFVATPIAFHRLGWEHLLYNFATGGETLYSDMNGYGHSWAPWIWSHLYWAALAVLLAVLSTLLWVRGEETGTAWRLRLMRARFSRPVRAVSALCCLLLLFTGGFIFYNTNVLNDYRTSRAEERMMAEYERRYSRYEGIAQPRVVGVDVQVDLHPRDRDLLARGVFRLRNRSTVPISAVHVNFPQNATARAFRFDREATVTVRDDQYGYYIYRLARPLAPGDSLRLSWRMDYRTEGFTNEVENDGALYNGTFVHQSRFPTIGYSAQSELRDDDVRRRNGLKPKDAEPPPDDRRGRMNPDISSDADWVDFAATVSTDADQVALAPGYLTREWTANGRRYFRYEMDAPVLNFYAFLSARYQVRRARWRDVAIEVFHHPGHEYNVDRMIHAAKRSLDYYTTHFGPYPHRQLRIVEFPRYASFAQSFPTTIPFSEGIGFIARVDEDDVDYVFHVTAHEVAHQWWGHQVVGGAVQGSALLSESLSEYSALMAMEKEYGQEGVEKFLRYELDGYLTGRAQERRKEVPLVRMAAEQTYLRYNKGALAFYTLRDYIGEDRLNRALRGYLESVRYQEPPYTNSLELIRHLRAATPDSLQYVISDLFEQVTLYENRAERAGVTRTRDGRYEVDLHVVIRKVRADSLGNETEVRTADWIDVGVFGEAPEKKGRNELGPPLYLRKHKLGPGRHTIRVAVAQPPARAGIDPLHRLIDRQMSDNTVAVRAR